jgi:hypothetical protein
MSSLPVPVSLVIRTFAVQGPIRWILSRIRLGSGSSKNRALARKPRDAVGEILSRLDEAERNIGTSLAKTDCPDLYLGNLKYYYYDRHNCICNLPCQASG